MDVLKFGLKPVIKKREATGIKKERKITTGVCFKDEDGIFKIHVVIDGSANRVLEFTPNSYELRGKTHVFQKTPNKDGKYICRIRSEASAKYAPGNPETYTPFCQNWVYKGHVCTIYNKVMFDVTDIVCVNGHELDEHTINS